MSGSVRFAGRLAKQVGIPVADLPVFLCPGILRFPFLPSSRKPKEPPPCRFQAPQQRHISSITPSHSGSLPTVLAPLLERLPQQCAGCGALSQTVNKEAPGFYTPTRNSILQYLERNSSSRRSAEDDIVRSALENAGLAETGISLADFSAPGKYPILYGLKLSLTSE
jgi:hypothetical protein